MTGASETREDITVIHSWKYGTNTVKVSRLAIAAGSIAIGVLGVVAPRRLARVMGDDPTLARPLAIRDGLIGAALLRWSGPAPLFIRTAADVSDAIRLRHRSPITAAAALAFGLWSCATAVASLKSASDGKAPR